jgi:FtsP/CotA-like multicopper oxidase with cupredoxin domain
MNRRDALRLGLVSGVSLLLPLRKASAALIQWPTGGRFDELSPAIVDEFKDELKSTTFKIPLDRADLLLPANGGALPNGTVYPQITGADALTMYRNSLERIVALHQRNSGNNVQFPPELFYVLQVKEARHAFHNKPPYAGGSVIWGYDGLYPGPTFRSRHGVPILVRIINEINDLYFDEHGDPRPDRAIPGGFGDPLISTHLHNGHTGSESDGNPADVCPPLPRKPDTLHVPQYPDSIRKLRFRDHHYALFRAGLNPLLDTGHPSPNMNEGDITESVSTLWYHDHSIHATAQNTYKGLVGVHLVYDESDTGNENDPAPALKLPSGEFDVPLLFQDKQFRLVENETGMKVAELHLPPKRPESDTTPVNFGFLGDVVAVNGQLKPKLSVKRRKYRFRLVNAGPSRFYQFFLTRRPDLNTSPPDDQCFIQIGNDESLLEKPYDVPKEDGLLLAVAERADIVIDFQKYDAGDKLYFVNRLIMKNGGEGPDWVPQSFPDVFRGYKTVQVAGSNDPGDYLLLFDVVSDPVDDPSLVPPELRKRPRLPTVAFGDISVAATKGQTLVFRHADLGMNQGFVFDDASRVLLTGEAPATKPNAVLQQTDSLGRYGQAVPSGASGPMEIARFDVIRNIGAPLPFHSVVQPTMAGRLEQAGLGGPGRDLHQITVDAGPNAQWVCGIQDLTPAQLKLLGNRHRSFKFETIAGEWTINGRPFHTSPAGSAKSGIGRLDVPRNSMVPGWDGPDGEVWTFSNLGPWAHPVHIHLEEFQILRRGKGELPKLYENSKKDVLRLDPLEEVQIFLRFRDFLGKYPIHCHNVIHEDHEMMLRFDIVGDW